MIWILHYPPGEGNREVAREIIDEMQGLEEIPKEVADKLPDDWKLIKRTEEYLSRFTYCQECAVFHENIAFCVKCGVCLNRNSEQVEDDKWPLFKCTKCGTMNFWD